MSTAQKKSKSILPRQSLTEADYKSLEKDSCIPRALVDAAELYRVDNHDGADIVGRKPRADQDYSGVVFPYFLPAFIHYSL